MLTMILLKGKDHYSLKFSDQFYNMILVKFERAIIRIFGSCKRPNILNRNSVYLEEIMLLVTSSKMASGSFPSFQASNKSTICSFLLGPTTTLSASSIENT